MKIWSLTYRIERMELPSCPAIAYTVTSTFSTLIVHRLYYSFIIVLDFLRQSGFLSNRVRWVRNCASIGYGIVFIFNWNRIFFSIKQLPAHIFCLFVLSGVDQEDAAFLFSTLPITLHLFNVISSVCWWQSFTEEKCQSAKRQGSYDYSREYL